MNASLQGCLHSICGARISKVAAANTLEYASLSPALVTRCSRMQKILHFILLGTSGVV
jgi:hypothetical protein